MTMASSPSTTASRSPSSSPTVGMGKHAIKQRFIELRAQGLSFSKIAVELSISKSTATVWARELDGEIARLRVVELEALYEQYHLLKEGRIRLLGDTLTRLHDEFATRDLSDISTDKLLDLLLRYRAVLLEEYVDLDPLSDEDVQLLNESPSTALGRGTGP